MANKNDMVVVAGKILKALEDFSQTQQQAILAFVENALIAQPTPDSGEGRKESAELAPL